jgi:hypothetical protein
MMLGAVAVEGVDCHPGAPFQGSTQPCYHMTSSKKTPPIAKAQSWIHEAEPIGAQQLTRSKQSETPHKNLCHTSGLIGGLVPPHPELNPS